MIHLAPFHPYLIDRLIAYLDETGDLIGYLEWAAPMIEETGAVFYFMRVCHDSSSRNQYHCGIDK